MANIWKVTDSTDALAANPLTETGTGSLVFSSNPTLSNGAMADNTFFKFSADTLAAAGTAVGDAAAVLDQ